MCVLGFTPVRKVCVCVCLCETFQIFLILFLPFIFFKRCCPDTSKSAHTHTHTRGHTSDVSQKCYLEHQRTLIELPVWFICKFIDHFARIDFKLLCYLGLTKTETGCIDDCCILCLILGVFQVAHNHNTIFALFTVCISNTSKYFPFLWFCFMNVTVMTLVSPWWCVV